MSNVIAFDRSPFTNGDLDSIQTLIGSHVRNGLWGSARRHRQRGLDAYTIYATGDDYAPMLYAVVRQEDGTYLLYDESFRKLAEGRTVDVVLDVLK